MELFEAHFPAPQRYKWEKISQINRDTWEVVAATLHNDGEMAMRERAALACDAVQASNVYQTPAAECAQRVRSISTRTETALIVANVTKGRTE